MEEIKRKHAYSKFNTNGDKRHPRVSQVSLKADPSVSRNQALEPKLPRWNPGSILSAGFPTHKTMHMQITRALQTKRELKYNVKGPHFAS